MDCIWSRLVALIVLVLLIDLDEEDVARLDVKVGMIAVQEAAVADEDRVGVPLSHGNG